LRHARPAALFLISVPNPDQNYEERRAPKLSTQTKNGGLLFSLAGPSIPRARQFEWLQVCGCPSSHLRVPRYSLRSSRAPAAKGLRHSDSPELWRSLSEWFRPRPSLLQSWKRQARLRWTIATSPPRWHSHPMEMLQKFSNATLTCGGVPIGLNSFRECFAPRTIPFDGRNKKSIPIATRSASAISPHPPQPPAAPFKSLYRKCATTSSYSHLACTRFQYSTRTYRESPNVQRRRLVELGRNRLLGPVADQITYIRRIRPLLKVRKAAVDEPLTHIVQV
jgi:hypothetical protein